MEHKGDPSEIIFPRCGHMFIFKSLNTRNVFLMKKVLFTSLFAACAAMGLSSCMNGDYDATPNANNGTTNPLANNNGGGGGGGGTSGGSITCKIDGTSYTFTQATYNMIGTLYSV